MAKSDIETALKLQPVKASTPILPLPPKPINVRNLRTAKRLLSRIITSFQRGELEDQRARTMAYLLISFVTLVKDYELELRVASLEKRAKE